ncbi:MAG: protein kinase [Defluviitaleaceae bacterium]|nr:protein kinase [Defluviitaleaceae bacterium]
MAARTSARMTYKAECTLKYRYKCEQCKFVTWEFESKLQQIAQHRQASGGRFSVNLDLNIKALENTKQQALERLENLKAAIKKMVYEASYEIVEPNEPFIVECYNEVLSEGQACPRCGKRQTWYPAAYRRISKFKNALRNAIVAVVVGNVLGFVAFDLTPLYLIIAQAVLLAGGGLTGLLCATSRIKSRKQHFQDTPRLRVPVITWGEPVVELMGASSIQYNEPENPVKAKGIKLITTKLDVKKESLSHWHMYNIKHDNLLSILDIIDNNYGVFSIIEEDFDSIPLSYKLRRKISEYDFQDYILQLCDALEFLHQQEPPVSHNAVAAENILVGKDRLVKLSNYDNITIGGTPADDIAMIGRLIESVNEKYIKRYEDVIKNCFGTYQTIDEFRDEFTPILKSPYAKIAGSVAMIIFIIIFISRRFF